MAVLTEKQLYLCTVNYKSNAQNSLWSSEYCPCVKQVLRILGICQESDFKRGEMIQIAAASAPHSFNVNL